MRKLILILLLIPFLSYSQKRMAWAKTQRLNVFGHTVHIEGNSIAYGTYDTVNWPELFCNARGATKDNNAISGQTMINPCGFAVFDKTTINTYSEGDVLVIELGLNDIGFNNSTDADDYEAKYDEVLDYATGTKGWPASRIVLLTPHKPIDFSVYVGGCSGTITVESDDTRIQSFIAKVISVGAAHGCKVINMYQVFDDADLDSSYYYLDKLHLSDLGQTFFANYLITHL